MLGGVDNLPVGKLVMLRKPFPGELGAFVNLPSVLPGGIEIKNLYSLACFVAHLKIRKSQDARLNFHLTL